MIWRTLGLGFTAALLAVHAARAETIFVNNVAGDDRNFGRIEELGIGVGPVRTIARALALAMPGDQIVLAKTGVAYREMVSLDSGRLSGTSAAPFVIDGRGATLDGSVDIPSTAWEAVAGSVFRFRPARMAYQQLFRDGRPLVRYQAATASPLNVADLQPLDWALEQGWIYFRAETNRLPMDYRLSCCGLQTGITLYQVHGVRIENLVVQGFQLDGVNAADNVRDCKLRGLVLRGNGRAGLTVAGSSRVELAGSTLGDNGDSQLRCEGWSHTAIVASQLLDNTAPALDYAGGTVDVDGARLNPLGSTR